MPLRRRVSKRKGTPIGEIPLNDWKKKRLNKEPEEAFGWHTGWNENEMKLRMSAGAGAAGKKPVLNTMPNI